VGANPETPRRSSGAVRAPSRRLCSHWRPCATSARALYSSALKYVTGRGTVNQRATAPTRGMLLDLAQSAPGPLRLAGEVEGDPGPPRLAFSDRSSCRVARQSYACRSAARYRGQTTPLDPDFPACLRPDQPVATFLGHITSSTAQRSNKKGARRQAPFSAGSQGEEARISRPPRPPHRRVPSR